MPRWNQALSDYQSDGDSRLTPCDLVGITYDSYNRSFAHMVALDPDRPDPLSEDELTSIYLRFWCHRMIDHMPDAAVPELMETLSELCEFYAIPAVDVVALPPATKTVKPASVTRSIAPTFVLDDD